MRLRQPKRSYLQLPHAVILRGGVSRWVVGRFSIAEACRRTGASDDRCHRGSAIILSGVEGRHSHDEPLQRVRYAAAVLIKQTPMHDDARAELLADDEIKERYCSV